MRGPQSVKKDVWYLGGRKKKQVVRKKKLKKGQRDKGFPLGLLASVGVPFLGEIAKPIIKKFFGRGKRRYR